MVRDDIDVTDARWLSTMAWIEVVSSPETMGDQHAGRKLRTPSLDEYDALDLDDGGDRLLMAGAAQARIV